MQLSLHYPKDKEETADMVPDCQVLRQMGPEMAL